jgi:hypothetical protein
MYLEERCVLSTLRVTHDFNLNSAADPPDAHNTLAWAVANAQNGDTILLTADVEKTGITLTQGELILTQQNLTIETEPGKDAVTISGDNLSRVFELAPGAQVTLSNVVIASGNGLANNPASLAGNLYGGGIVVDAGAALTVSGSTLSGNFAFHAGGGIDNQGGTVTVIGSTISGNGGGGIDNQGGTVTITGSTVYENEAGNDSNFNLLGGGGIYNQGGTVTVSGSTVSGNDAAEGGGIDNEGGTVTITGSTLSGNSAGEGAGVFNAGGTVTITGSTLSGNSAFEGAGIFNDQGALVVSGSSVSGNTAFHFGGGIFNDATIAGAYALINDSSTVSGNLGTPGADVYNVGLSVLYLDNSSTIGVLYDNPAILI